MPNTLSTSDIEEILNSGRFEELIGSVEDEHLECKAAPYQLDQDRKKMELAKDVSALANADGGFLLIGVQTEKNPSHLGDEIRSIRALPSNLVDCDQYLNVLAEWVYPAIRGLRIKWCAGTNQDGSGIVSVKVPQECCQERPYVVGKVVESTGKIVGSYVGYFERVQSGAKPISFEELRERLKDGYRFSELDGRLRDIEAALGRIAASPNPVVAGISDQTVSERVVAAGQVAHLSDRPSIDLTAWSPSDRVEFTSLFESRSAPVVKLLENPPHLRYAGFDLNTGQASEIIRGQLRRSEVHRDKLLELWRDGVLIFVAPGDEWFLCWGMESDATTGLRINNIALTEVTYLFCNLALKIFEHSVPQPGKLEFRLGLRRLITQGGPCRLSARRPNRMFPDAGNAAPEDQVIIQRTVQGLSEDPGVISYGLLAELYAWFGFETVQLPYVKRDAQPPRIDVAQLA
jgi:Putative DNA-binding domain